MTAGAGTDNQISISRHRAFGLAELADFKEGGYKLGLLARP